MTTLTLLGYTLKTAEHVKVLPTSRPQGVELATVTVHTNHSCRGCWGWSLVSWVAHVGAGKHPGATQPTQTQPCSPLPARRGHQEAGGWVKAGCHRALSHEVKTLRVMLPRGGPTLQPFL